jgi:hypothetical protein
MKSSFARHTFVFLVSILSAAGCFAQTQTWGAWATVSKADCGCAPPVDVCCKITGLVCERRDSGVTVTPGTPGRVVGSIGKCKNCPPCCARGDCPDMAALNCGTTSTVSFQQSFSVSISPKISGELSEALKIELGVALGWSWQTQLTVTAKCEQAAMPCTRVIGQAYVDFTTNGTATVHHQWRLAGTWFNPGGCTSCPTPGVFFKACGDSMSTAKANIAVANDCSNLCTDKCSPGECDTYE